MVLVVLAACARPLPPPPPLALTDGWERIPVTVGYPDPVFSLSGLRRVQPGGKGVWLATGSTSGAAGSLSRPGALASGDGEVWRTIGVPSPDNSGGITTAAASEGDLAVMVGSVGVGSDQAPAVWTSKDGWSWAGPTTLPLPAEVTGGVTAFDVTPGPGGWTVVGGAVGASAGWRAAPAMIWSSADGQAWDRVDAQGIDGRPPGADPALAFRSVTATGRILVAVATTPGCGAAGDPASPTSGPVGSVWSSTDGRVWRQQALDGFGDAPRPCSAARVGDTVAVSVGDGGAAGRLAVTTDGRQFAAGLDLPAGAGGIRLLGRDDSLAAFRAAAPVDRTEIFALASGSDLSGTSPTPWRTVEVPGSDGGDSNGPSAGAVGAAVLGADQNTLMLSEPQARAQRLWRQLPAQAWEAADTRSVPPPRRREAERILGMAGNGTVTVAVGDAAPSGSDEAEGATSSIDPDPSGAGAAAAGGRLWVAEGDLHRWRAIPVSATISRLTGVAWSGSSFLAVGIRGPDGRGGPVVLGSSDGVTWIRRDDPSLDPVPDTAGGTALPAAPAPTTSGSSGSSTGSGAAGLALPSSVAWAADHFVVGGARLTPEGSIRPAVWRTVDGARLDDARVPGSGPGAVTGLCAGRSGVTATISAAGQADQSSVWSSPDGEVWVADTAGLPAAPSLTFGACGSRPDAAEQVLVGSGGGSADRPRFFRRAEPAAPWRESGRAAGPGSAHALRWTGQRWLAVGTRPGPAGAPSGLVLVAPAAVGDRPDDAWPTDPVVERLVGEPGASGLWAATGGNDQTLLGGLANDGAVVLVGPG